MRHEQIGGAPITETGLVRISGNRKAIRSAATPAIAIIAALRAWAPLTGHAFPPDDVALVLSADGNPPR